MDFLNAEKEKNNTLPFDARVYETENYSKQQTNAVIGYILLEKFIIQ